MLDRLYSNACEKIAEPPKKVFLDRFLQILTCVTFIKLNFKTILGRMVDWKYSILLICLFFSHGHSCSFSIGNTLTQIQPFPTGDTTCFSQTNSVGNLNDNAKGKLVCSFFD